MSQLYWVVMRDYGSSGREAIVDPNISRRKMIERISTGEDRNVLFIHETRDYGDGQGIVTTNITEEVFSEVIAGWLKNNYDDLAEWMVEFINDHHTELQQAAE